MNPAPTMPWLWPAIAITLAVIGLIVLVFALFRDRSRGRRRCPKCWYSMDGAPTLTCPECGRVAKTEKKLFKTRRSRRGIAVALTLVIASYGAWKWPVVRRGGWTEFIPTTALACIAPTSPLEGLDPYARLSTHSIADQLRHATTRRMTRGCARWQSQHYIQRCADAHGPNPGEWIAAPHTWRRGVPIPVKVRPRLTPPVIPDLYGLMVYVGPSAMEDGRLNPDALVPTSAANVFKVQLEIRLSADWTSTTLYKRVVPLSITLVDDPALVLRPIDTPEATAIVAAAVAPELVLTGNGYDVFVGPRSTGGSPPRIDFGIGYEVLVEAPDGRVVGKGSGFAANDRWGRDRRRLPTEWVSDADRRSLTPGSVRFVVIGNAELALKDRSAWSFEANSGSYWSGRIEVPPEPLPDGVHKP
jgi:hypothetical protein